jgi:FtsZ-binding cell division protein ZapB
MVTLAALGGLGLLGFLWWLVQCLIDSTRRETALKIENDSLKEKQSKFQEKIAESEKEIAKLKEQTSDKVHKDNLLSKYDFDKRSGSLIHKETKQRYCYSCLQLYNRETQLTEDADGWRCHLCPRFYENPDYYPPRSPESQDDDGGYGHY